MAKLVSMELDDEDQIAGPSPYPTLPRFKFPPGLRICLNEDQLEKLKLEANCDEGDFIHLFAFATVTSVHKENGGKRVELQIEKMAVENESKESPDDDEKPESESEPSEYEE